ncbi:MAG: DUF2071 domain-containing protein [Thermoanaerobaculia bacterium]
MGAVPPLVAGAPAAMVLQTTVRDCLYLNWAIPARSLPAVPEPLRHELHAGKDREWGFASAVLFFQEGLRMRGVPWVRLAYPQANLRFNVLDGDGLPAVYFRRMLVPLWVVPAGRVVGRQPTRAARLDFPRPSRDPEAEAWVWRARWRDGGPAGEEGLVVTARPGAPQAPGGPDLGSWEETVRFFRERRRGYSRLAGRLRRIDTRQPPAPVWPLKVEVVGAELVAAGLGLEPANGEGGGLGWELHSAWLCPEMSLTFEVVRAPEPEEPVRRRVPAAG